MKVQHTTLPEVLIVEPNIVRDARGFFMESWNAQRFRELIGQDRTFVQDFVQDNHSCSEQYVLRGIHYQLVKPQGKLVRVVVGRVLDVAVDLRRSSPCFGKSVSVELSADNHRQLWIPPGFGHGFLTLSPRAEVLYKTTEFWYPEHERRLRWDDAQLGIDWGLARYANDRDSQRLNNITPLLSPQDAQAPLWCDAETYA